MKGSMQIDWQQVHQQLNLRGYATVRGLLSREECVTLQMLYDEKDIYRNVINMQRYRFGEGEYKYFSYPLPPPVQEMREALYTPLASLANEWSQLLSLGTSYPASHADFITICHATGQHRPTPLILRYGPGGFNTLHQDLYGGVYFPFQVVFILTQKGIDHEGGELVITEQVPRAQSKAEVIAPDQGDAVIFTTNFRPVKGSRGYFRAKVKHGVSRVTAGRRFALGVIFHDAE